MSSFNESDSEGNYSNELGDRSDAEGHGTVFNIDQFPGQLQSSQLADGANTIPSGTSMEAVPSKILNAAPKRMRKRKPGSRDGAKQKEKLDDDRKRYKNELTSFEADIKFVNDQCDLKLEYYKRERAFVDSLRRRINEETDEITEICMQLINNESG